MMTKLKTLRNCPSLRRREILDVDIDPSTLKHLKTTPGVMAKLKVIEKFDNDIKETIELYKFERLQRLQTQNEMCNEISSRSYYDGQMFLEMCHFETSDDADNVEPEVTGVENTNTTEAAVRQQQQREAKNFIRRNIELAKEGIMAGCSLTDEEKKKLEDLLAESDGPYSLEDDDVHNAGNREINNDSSPESDDDSDGDQYYISNAYVIQDNEKRRMDDINSELEKFTLDETEKEKRESVASKYDKCDWNRVLAEQRVKNIDAKLCEIRKSYEDEKTKDNQNASEDVENGDEVEDAGNGSDVTESSIDEEKLFELYDADEANNDKISAKASDLVDSEK